MQSRIDSQSILVRRMSMRTVGMGIRNYRIERLFGCPRTLCAWLVIAIRERATAIVVITQ